MLSAPKPSFHGGRPLLLLLVSMATNLSWRVGGSKRRIAQGTVTLGEAEDHCGEEAVGGGR
jgi:hypothetical protein